MPEASEVEPTTVGPVVRPTASQVALAGGLLAVELVAGIQTYLSQTVLPLMAADLGAQSLYGVVTATGAVANFAGLPLGMGLAARFRIPRLLIGFTIVISAGALVSALAPSIWWFLLGTAVRGFASGCIATVSMSAVVTGLSGRVRQITLSSMSAMWVIAALFGPTYAAWISHLLNWRWALVLYLPVLLVARGIVARHLPEHERSEDAQVGWADAVLLGLAMACIAAPVESEWLQMVLLIGGIVLLVVATRRVLPRGTFRLTSRRRAVIAFMFGLCGLYFAVDSVVAIVAHDVFGASAGDIGAIIMAGGLAWALVGLYCGWKPAVGVAGYLRRASVGIALIAVGVLAMSFAGREWFGLAPIPTLAAGWALAGIGMGLCYVDTLNLLFTPPLKSDGLSDLDVSGAAVMSESIAAIATMTAATAFLSTGFGGELDVGARSTVLLTFAGLAVVALFVPLVALRGQD